LGEVDPHADARQREDIDAALGRIDEDADPKIIPSEEQSDFHAALTIIHTHLS
jgi:hypothetical protein